MTRFNLSSKLIGLFVIAFAALSGCVKADKKNPYETAGGRQTQFRLSKAGPLLDVTGYADNLIKSGDVTAERNADISVQGENARYSNRREYSMTLCGLTDMRTGNILGQKLKVYSELDVQNQDLEVGRKTEVMIENNDCVYWQVSIPYAYFADSVNLEVNFVFVTTTGQKAYIHKKMLFNPWDARRGSNPETFDFTRFGLSEAMRRMPWARGVDEIDLALQGKLLNTTKRLEVGQVNIKPIDKTAIVRNGNLVGNYVMADINEQQAVIEAQRVRQAVESQLAGTGDGTYERLPTLDLQLGINLNNLKVRLLDTAGNNKDENLTTGRYRIYAQLVAMDANFQGHYIITDKLIISDEKTWNTSTMGVNAVLPISVVLRPQWGNLKLILKVVPVDLPGIEPFEGIYHLGKFNEIISASANMFDLSEFTRSQETGEISFHYDEFLKQARNYKEWESHMIAQSANELTLENGFRRFQFSNLSVMFSRIMAGDTATDRTIQYTVETCVIDNYTGARPGFGLQFEIVTEDKGQEFKIIRETNELGCLNWVGMISHKVYFRENLIPKVSKLTYLGADSNRPKYELKYYINPWDEKFTFGRDSRILPQEYIDQVAAQQKLAPPTRVLMADFKYDATGFRYVIDRYMNMTVKKTVLMTIHPKILKYNSIVWGRSGSSELRDGIYLLKIAMQKDYLDPAAPGRKIIYGSDGHARMRSDEESIEKKQFLVVKEMLVRVLGGMIITPVEFDVTDLRTLRIRSQMLIQIETIDEMLLRAVALADEKLSGIIGADGQTRTIEIMNAQTDVEEINRILDEAKKKNDIAQVARLMEEQAAAVANVRRLLSELGDEEFKLVVERIAQLTGLQQSGLSVDRNLKADALNSMISSLKAKLSVSQSERRRQIENQYEDSQTAQCRETQVRLEAEGKPEEAARWNPIATDTLCETSIPYDQLFYHLTTPTTLDADSFMRNLLTPEEFALYEGNNLRDDFTKPYQPNYNFSLLSNQGDELFHDNGEPRATEDHSVSGLPRRTFIGPITFVLNGNGSAVRPTDVLDEATCPGTCEALEEVEQSVIQNAKPQDNVAMNFGAPVNLAYEQNPYYGSVRHFYKKQVNDLIAMERGLKHQYHQEMMAFSEVGNLLEQMLFNYVSFGSQPAPVRYLDQGCYSNWKNGLEETYAKWRSGEDLSFQVQPLSQDCFKPSARVYNKNRFLEHLNNPPADPRNVLFPQVNFVSSDVIRSYRLSPVAESDFKEFAKNGLASRRLSIDTKANILHKMCYHLRTKFMPVSASGIEQYKKKMGDAVRANLSNSPYNILGILDANPNVGYYFQALKNEFDAYEGACHTAVDNFREKVAAGTGNADAISRLTLAEARKLPIIVERKVRVVETSNRYIYKDGKTLNYSVGTNFSLSNSANMNRGYKIDPIESIEKTAGVLGRIGEGFSKLIGSLGGFLNFQWGFGESLADSNGTSVSAGTTLAGQISTLDIELAKWEKCVIVRFEERAFLDKIKTLREPRFHFYNASEAMQSVGSMMCSGDIDEMDDNRPTQKLRVRERYYYFTQIFNEGDMQDSGSLANHPWMLQMRGASDFARFHNALTASPYDLRMSSAYGMFWQDTKNIAFGNEDGQRTLTPLEVVKHEDIEKSLDMMREAYSRVLPTFPGMFTYSDLSEDEVTTWNGN